MSIAGGYYKAVERAKDSTCDCVQVFTKNNNQWRAKPIVQDDVDQFQAALSEHKIKHPLSHASYLINLAAPDNTLWKKSLDAMVVELQRADQLGIPYVVLHPGAYTTSSEEAGIKRIVEALDEIHDQTLDLESICLLETTAGQGSCLGCRFEELAEMLQQVKQPDRLGVCLDTCHVFAAGYEIHHEKGYKKTISEFNKLVGVKTIKAFHLNDSKKPCGSRVDRHDHIGEGEIGIDAFRFLLNDRRFRKVPMYLETPKKGEGCDDWDAKNLEVLRSLISI